jgi:hypothetical protein
MRRSRDGAHGDDRKSMPNAVTTFDGFSVRDLWRRGPAEISSAKAGKDYSVKIDARGASRMLVVHRVFFKATSECVNYTTVR